MPRANAFGVSGHVLGREVSRTFQETNRRENGLSYSTRTSDAPLIEVTGCVIHQQNSQSMYCFWQHPCQWWNLIYHPMGYGVAQIPCYLVFPKVKHTLQQYQVRGVYHKIITELSSQSGVNFCDISRSEKYSCWHETFRWVQNLATCYGW